MAAGKLRMLQFESGRTDHGVITSTSAVLLLALAICVAAIGGSSAAECNAGDKLALLTFKSQLLDPRNALSSWTPTSDCCKWPGITCDGEGQRVTKFELAGIYVFPNIDLYTLKVKPDTPAPGASLGALKELTTLLLVTVDFGFDYPIPAEFGTLPKLEKLVLINTRFRGDLPSSLGSLSKLISMTITDNHLNGGIPESFGNLKALTDLNLSNNNLTTIGSQSITKLKNLSSLELGYNKLSGPIPKWLGELTVEYLGLGHNVDLKGPIPGELCNIKGLKGLSIYNTKVTAIPQEIGNCKSLRSLVMYENKLRGELPAGLASLEKLQRIELSGNRMSGTLLPGLGDLPDLTEFNVANNQFTGTIPPNYGPFVEDEDATSFSGNKLYGPIPSALSTLPVKRFRPGNEGLCGPPLAPCKTTQVA